MLIFLLLIQVIAVLGDGGKCEPRSLLMDLVEMVPRHGNTTLSKCEEHLVELGRAWQDQQSWALKGEFGVVILGISKVYHENLSPFFKIRNNIIIDFEHEIFCYDI